MLPKRKDCTCICHDPGQDLRHCMPCCIDGTEEHKCYWCDIPCEEDYCSDKCMDAAYDKAMDDIRSTNNRDKLYRRVNKQIERECKTCWYYTCLNCPDDGACNIDNNYKDYKSDIEGSITVKLKEIKKLIDKL